MRRRDPDADLPPFALEYLSGVPSARRVVHAFHVWLKRTGRPIRFLEPSEVQAFATPFLNLHTAQRRVVHRRRLLRYLDWLRDRQLLSFDPRLLWPRGSVELPPHALRFVASLEPVLKPSSIGSYRTCLRQFYVWLASQTQTLDTLERHHISSWLDWLHKRGLGPAHRIRAIQGIRAYLRWLEEQPDYAGKSADHLFRRGDLPKLPQYLPRPLPLDLDRELQRRLRKSRSPARLGLLLMRRTGLRIGELRNLPLHCVHTDSRGREFLKVPLGKLNNERLVPLDPKTSRLISKLVAFGSTGRHGKRRRFLLERPPGRAIAYEAFRLELARACRGLVDAKPITSHRLRHTFATSMLAAGVSLPSLMRLLGHRDYRMTLRYAAVTIETVTSEYETALERVEQRYELRSATKPLTAPKTISDLARHLLRELEDAGLDKSRGLLLVRRLNRLNAAIQRLLRDCARARAPRQD